MSRDWSVWRLHDNQAQLASTAFRCCIDIVRPANGLTDIHYGKFPLNGWQPLRVAPQPPAPTRGETLIESYARGEDLVATYAQTPPRTVRPQLYWRYQTGAAETVGIELLAAMQTSLLDSDPTLISFTDLPGGDFLWLVNEAASRFEPVDMTVRSRWDCSGSGGDPLFVFRPAGFEVSYGEIVYPADFQGAEVHRLDEGFRLTYRLFSEPLEKGVIRKARVVGVFLPRQQDLQLAMAWYRATVAAAPPLTA